jgi:DNA polymerase-3 subunit gamma/tau
LASLYRKWRSRSFEDLVGQEHVVRTLRNSVRSGRVAHAYLFTGPRGTGKTSTARILAKALNCLHPLDGNPCNRCENCVAANEGRALDVIEIDAASNTSVDNVRDLRERVGYAASEGRYKVYIIDEVHRLSGAAFDAFLKTLEEPPAHVVFVFASTEPHKVPATIMSRCQRFDFKRMSLAETTGHLRYIAGEESIEIDDDAIVLIGQSAGGSMRDAVGLLDQAAAYSSDRLDAQAVRQALGLADPTLVARLVDHLLDGTVGDGLRDCSAFVDAGGDPGQLVAELIQYWRGLLLARSGAGGLDGAVDPALVPDVERHARRVSETQIVAVLGALTTAEFSSKYDVPPQLPLELGYVRSSLALAQPEPARVARAAEPAASRTPRATPVPPREVKAPAPVRNEPISPSEPPPRHEPPPPVVSNGAIEPPPVTPPSGVREPASAANFAAMKERILTALKTSSPTVQALLRSGYILAVGDGEVTFGFQFDFHMNQLNEASRRKLLEEATSQVLGASYRVKCVRASVDEVKARLGDEAVVEDDGFVQEAAERLRRFHVRELGNGTS